MEHRLCAPQRHMVGVCVWRVVALKFVWELVGKRTCVRTSTQKTEEKIEEILVRTMENLFPGF